MRPGLPAVFLIALVPPTPQEPGGVVLERDVRQVLLDALNRRREIRRKEIVRIRGDNVAVTDLTFGERLIVRSDLKKVWQADLLAGEISELTLDQVSSTRRRAFEKLRDARARVPGTAEERELDALLESYEQYGAEPKVELRESAGRWEVLVNGTLVRASVERTHPQLRAEGYFAALERIGAFHPAVGARLRELGGVPMRGRLRYVLFLDRVHEEFEVTSARAEEVPDSEFEPPAGLRRVPLRGFESVPERSPPRPAQFTNDFKEDEVDRQNAPFRREEKEDRDKP